MKRFDSILLVDDDYVSMYLAKHIISECNLAKDVHEALNGKEALAFLENKQVDLIFLDIKMPVMNGFAFLDEAKRTSACVGTGIVMLSSSVDSIDIERSESYDEVLGYIEKPLTKDKLEEIITREYKSKLAFEKHY